MQLLSPEEHGVLSTFLVSPEPSEIEQVAKIEHGMKAIKYFYKSTEQFSCVAQNRQQDACQAAQHCSGVLRDIQIFPLTTQHKPTIHVPTQNYSPFSHYPARTILFRLPASSASENKIQSLISEMQHCADLCLRRSLQQMGDPLLEEPVETSSTALLHHGLRR